MLFGIGEIQVIPQLFRLFHSHVTGRERNTFNRFRGPSGRVVNFQPCCFLVFWRSSSKRPCSEICKFQDLSTKLQGQGIRQQVFPEPLRRFRPVTLNCLASFISLAVIWQNFPVRHQGRLHRQPVRQTPKTTSVLDDTVPGSLNSWRRGGEKERRRGGEKERRRGGEKERVERRRGGEEDRGGEKREGVGGEGRERGEKDNGGGEVIQVLRAPQRLIGGCKDETILVLTKRLMGYSRPFTHREVF